MTLPGADLRGGCRGCAFPPPEMTCGFLIQLVFCKKNLWFIGVEAEQEMSAPPPKKNPGSAPASAQASLCWREAGESTKGRCMENNGKRKEKKTRGSCLFLILIVHLCLLFSFIITIFIKMRTCSLCEGESKVSITETCILYGHNNINKILIMYTDSLVII